MKIKKRNGRLVNFNPNNITKRIKDQSKKLSVDPDSIAIKVISQIKDGITTRELDNLAIEQAATMVTIHPDYSQLAGKLFITQLHRETPTSFSEATEEIKNTTGLLTENYLEFVENNSEVLDRTISDERDFNHDYFGLKTLEKSYLIRTPKKKVIERPQYMWMRTAIECGNYELKQVIKTYNLLSQGYYTHATPTLFNSGTNHPQLSSCFLLGMKNDSIDGIFDTLKDCANISKWAGGIGLHIHNIRSNGSHISGTNGHSNGIVPMLRVFNDTARYVDQGGGKRKGSFAIYVEPWHPDILDFLDLKKNHGKEEMRARDLFYAMWTPDLFMERVKSDSDWTLFDPNVVRKFTNGVTLDSLHGEEFNKLYQKLENEGLGKVIKARDLWEKILVSQIETGTPYIGYKDRVNQANNQKNYGTIKSSNLCIEINEYSDDKEQAVCNLASIALPKFVKVRNGKYYFDFKELRKVAKTVVVNLDNVIDNNFYPTVGTSKSNFTHRPIGLGIQGLADVFAIMKTSFDSEEAKELNKLIFENLYFAALESSCELAYDRGTYPTFHESPASEGKLQFDLYDNDIELSENLNWDGLKEKIKSVGLRNSLLLAMMPTASTSQILGNNECFEPHTSNLSTRRVLAGEFIIINKHLIKDLEELGLWNEEMRIQLMGGNGSVQNIPTIPTEIKERYKTAYEMSMKKVIDMAADRQRFICQAQSMNIFMTDITIGKLNSMHFYGWSRGLKTGIYYLRSKSAVDAKKFTLDVKKEGQPIDPEEYKKMIQQAREAGEDDDCLACGA